MQAVTERVGIWWTKLLLNTYIREEKMLVNDERGRLSTYRKEMETYKTRTNINILHC